MQVVNSNFKFRSIVKSVEKVVFTIPGDSVSTSDTVTLSTTVDDSRSIILTCNPGFVAETQLASTRFDRSIGRFEVLAGGTQVKVSIDNSSSYYKVFTAHVVQFHTWAVNKVERGTISLNSLTTASDSTLDYTDLDYISVHSTGFTTNDIIGDWTDTNCNVSRGFPSTNIVTANKGNNTATVFTMGFERIQWNPAIIKKIQHVSATTTGTNTGGTTALSDNVDMSNTMVLSGHYSLELFQTFSHNRNYYAELTDVDTITLTRVGNSGVTGDFKLEVIEFNGPFIESISRDTFTMAVSASSDSLSVADVDSELSFLSTLGWTYSSTADSFDKSGFSVVIDHAGNQLDYTRVAASTNVPTTSTEMIESI